jgi:glycosyltransferase involved in cell wall biosynthesis
MHRPPRLRSDVEEIEAPATMRPRWDSIRVSVVIPTLDEVENLPHVFARFPHGLYEVILVDGHSIDDTVRVARSLRPDVRIVLQCGRGKGDALACGFAAARGDVIVTLDADGSTDPAEIPRFVEALLDGADFAKGSRFMEGAGSEDLTPIRRMGNDGLRLVVNAMFRTRYTDLCYGYNAFWATCLPHMTVACDGFEIETLMNVRVAKAGLRVSEVPSFESSRLFGASKLHPVRDGVRVLRTIVHERFNSADRSGYKPQFRELSVESQPVLPGLTGTAAAELAP